MTWKFGEGTLWDEQYRIRGHCDGLVSKDRLNWFIENTKVAKEDCLKACKMVQTIAPGKMAVLEMKSMGRFTYEKTDKPENIAPYYQMQSSIYMWKTGMEETF